MKYVLVATLTEYCSCNVYTGLLEPIRHSNIAPMGLSNEAGLSVDCGEMQSLPPQQPVEAFLGHATQSHWQPDILVLLLSSCHLNCHHCLTLLLLTLCPCCIL